MNFTMCIFAETFVLLTTYFWFILMDFLSYPKKKVKKISCLKTYVASNILNCLAFSTFRRYYFPPSLLLPEFSPC